MNREGHQMKRVALAEACHNSSNYCSGNAVCNRPQTYIRRTAVTQSSSSILLALGYAPAEDGIETPTNSDIDRSSKTAGF